MVCGEVFVHGYMGRQANGETHSCVWRSSYEQDTVRCTMHGTNINGGLFSPHLLDGAHEGVQRRRSPLEVGRRVGLAHGRPRHEPAAAGAVAVRLDVLHREAAALAPHAAGRGDRAGGRLTVEGERDRAVRRIHFDAAVRADADAPTFERD